MKGRIITWGDKVSKTMKRKFAKNPELKKLAVRGLMEYQKKHGNPFKGKHHTEKTKAVLSKGMTGKKHTEEHRKKIGIGVSKKYEDPVHRKKQRDATRLAQLGVPHSLETRRKQSDGVTKKWEDPEHRRSKSGENHWNWKGGISRDPYSKEFSEDLKLYIRLRDEFTCQLCNTTEDDLDSRLGCHHVDYDKNNNYPSNLISLCRGCNVKVNYDREYWVRYFVEIMVIRTVILQPQPTINTINKGIVMEGFW